MSFAELTVGQWFDFIKPNGLNSFFARCQKISARKYRWANAAKCDLSPEPYLIAVVGTKHVEVYNVADSE